MMVIENSLSGLLTLPVEPREGRQNSPSRPSRLGDFHSVSLGCQWESTTTASGHATNLWKSDEFSDNFLRLLVRLLPDSPLSGFRNSSRTPYVVKSE